MLDAASKYVPRSKAGEVTFVKELNDKICSLFSSVAELAHAQDWGFTLTLTHTCTHTHTQASIKIRSLTSQKGYKMPERGREPWNRLKVSFSFKQFNNHNIFRCLPMPQEKGWHVLRGQTMPLPSSRPPMLFRLLVFCEFLPQRFWKRLWSCPPS